MGKPARVKAVYDNGGKTVDRYTVVTDEPWVNGEEVAMLGLSENPDHPQGFSQWGGGVEGDHLGKYIEWSDLPERVQQHIITRFDDTKE